MHLLLHSIQNPLQIFIEKDLLHLQGITVKLSGDEYHGREGLLQGAISGFTSFSKAFLPLPLLLYHPKGRGKINVVCLPLYARQDNVISFWLVGGFWTDPQQQSLYGIKKIRRGKWYGTLYKVYDTTHSG
uniref:Uncharacterized protein n=1 Tax=Nelumbo nucifera TaxID=4432 RepID=A0A822ZEW7_NELNU|nr:TPA_asm: hypothetical protein HUJ06_002974 [Nelumbo nucifera]